MLERERLESKKISKTNAVTSMLDYELDEDDVHVGPSRPRAVAQGPQVVLHPDGGHDVRRRAAQRGAQARGLGQPQQRGRHHRRHPLPEAGPRSWPQGHARRALELLHEEPAAADPRRHRVQPGRGLHPGEDNETLVGTEAPVEAARSGSSRAAAERGEAAAKAPRRRRPAREPGSRRRPAERGKRLVAPHRRSTKVGGPSAELEKARRSTRYRAGTWLMSRLPVPVRARHRQLHAPAVVRAVAEEAALRERQLRARPGRPPASLEVRRKALAAYRSYARYVVELMRLPRMHRRPGGGARRHVSARCRSRRTGRQSGKGADPHVGAHRQPRGRRARHRPRTAGRSSRSPTTPLPGAVRRSSSASDGDWGVELIPWRNLRDLYGVLRRNEILALIIDWGYRADGHPGPAVRCVDDAARRARPRSRRRPGRRSSTSRSAAPRIGSVRRSPTATRSTSPSSDPASCSARPRRSPTRSRRRSPLRRSSGTASSRCGRRPARSRPSLARALQPGRRSVRAAGPDATAPGIRARPAARLVIAAASWLACRLPERPLLALADLAGRVWYRLAPERGDARARRT